MSTTEAPSTSQGSPFWRFSLGFYRQPKVADACIQLQEESGVDVNLLLFLLWQATRRRTLAVAEVEELERCVGPWREMTVIPLRAMRRALKSPPALVEAAAAELFRTKIKGVELEAERLQQEAMHALARANPLGREAPSREAAARANVAAYERMCRDAFSKPAVVTLLAALAGLEHSEKE
jgi:uncharacterized protein (TIGR02444 family)